MNLEQNPEAAQSFRLFVAIEFPPDTKTRIADTLSRLTKGAMFTGAHPTWVKPEGVHLTLLFLGWQAAERIPTLQSALSEAVVGHFPIELKLAKVELFPDAREPKVISLNVAGQLQRLQDLHDSVAGSCHAAGFAPETTVFRPHLTLGRIKSRKGLAGITNLVRSHADIAKCEFAVDHITLFRSSPGEGGSTYTIIDAFDLKP